MAIKHSTTTFKSAAPPIRTEHLRAEGRDANRAETAMTQQCEQRGHF